MRCVLVESPFAGVTEHVRSANVAYARRCLLDCLRRGEAGFASHLLYTQPGVLDDDKPDERALGIDAGLAWGQHADKVSFFIDRGISKGMRRGFQAALRAGLPIELRSIERLLSTGQSKDLLAQLSAPEQS